MSNFNISTRYARAYIDLAESRGKLKDVAEDMIFLSNTFEGSRELRNVLSNPVIKKDDKAAILIKLFEDRVSAATINFLKFIVDKNREDKLVDIVRRFNDMHDEKAGIVNAEVIGAYEIAEDLKEYFKKTVENYSKKSARVKYSSDINLIGGFRIRIGDTIVDASVKNQLELLRAKLLEENI
jgi:F-type H+-transporting ATPase subunit delta